MASQMTDTKEGVTALIDKIESISQNAIIFIDIEGVNLSRHGSIAIIQILIPPSPTVHLLDVHMLQKEAFETPGAKGNTLRDIFQSKEYPKVFFDVRRDSDALYAHFQVKLQAVIDLQLLEFASRPSSGGYLAGLAKCISYDAGLDIFEARECQEIKNAGCKLFAPEKGGSYEVFLQRPLSEAIVNYCVQDVKLLPKLLSVYASRLSLYVAADVNTKTINRVAESQSPLFTPNGRHMAMPPLFKRSRKIKDIQLPHPMNLVCSSAIIELCALKEEDPLPSTFTDSSEQSDVKLSTLKKSDTSMGDVLNLRGLMDPLNEIAEGRD